MNSNTLKGATKIYPDNYGLLSEVALALILKNNSTGEDALIHKALLLSNRVLKNCTNSKVLSTTTVNLCFLYLKVNEVEKAKNLAKTLPHIWECREILLAEMCNDDEYVGELKKSLIKILAVMCEKIKISVNHKYSNPDKIVTVELNLEDSADIKKNSLIT